ncbi:MAG: Crp/Fnr family transcriptional regulator [Microcystaceae cyanobacterium]
MLKPTDSILVFKNHPEKCLKAGEIIFDSGDRGEMMYGLLEGQVGMYLNGKLLELLEVGDAFGARALVHEEHLRFCSAIAKTDVKLAVMDREHFFFAVQQTPMFALELLRSYSERLRKVKGQLQALLD